MHLKATRITGLVVLLLFGGKSKRAYENSGRAKKKGIEMDEVSGGFVADFDRDFDQIFSAPNMTGTPERRLLLAILERAILDYVGNDPREVEEAEEWLFGSLEQGLKAQFSFSWLCEQLDLDPVKISRRIKAMPRRGNRKIAPWYFAKEELAVA
ncbi:MAG: hypothetical protein ACK5GN_14995 [Pseudomonadota bacterium]